MKRLILISSVVLAFFNSASATDEGDAFKHITTAYRFWLQKNDMLESRSLVDESTKNYLNLAPIAIDAILKREGSPWKVYKVTNYDGMTGVQIKVQYADLVVGQDGSSKQMVYDGYYFVAKGDFETGPRLIIRPTEEFYYSRVEYAYFDYTTASVSFNESDSAVAEEFISEFRSYVDGPQNPYRYQVLEFGGDYKNLYDPGFQLRFLLNVSDLNLGWDNLIMEKGIKDISFENTEGFLNLVDDFQKMGLQAKKGLLLEGPPGTGKSLLAQIMMSSILNGTMKDKVTFIIVTARHLKYKTAIQTLFHEAQRLSPAIVFIEDIDLLGVKKRSEGSWDTAGREEVLNEFLNGIDGAVDNKGLLVVATTNKVENVDPALLRSERLGIHLHYGLPGFSERMEFFEKFGKKNAVWDLAITVQDLAAKTEGLSGADIIEIIGLAKQMAIVDGSWADPEKVKLFITLAFFDEAIARVKENHGNGGSGFRSLKQPLSLKETMLRWKNVIGIE